MSKNKTMNKMGTQPVPKVMLNMGIPMILSMVLQACYNIVDSIFVARIPDVPGVVHAGEYAVNALTLAFPIQMLIVALGIGTGVGVNAILSRTLGEKDTERAAKIAGNGISLGILIYLVVLVFGMIGITPYLQSQTARLCILAIHIISAGFIFAGINIALQGVFQALGCGLDSLIVSVLRLLLIVLPLAWLLSLMPNALDIMWVAFPATEFISCLLAGGLMLKVNKRVIVTMEEPRVNAVYVKESNE